MALASLTDDLVRLKGPTEFSGGADLDQAYLTANGGSIFFRVFDAALQHVLHPASTRLRTAVAASGATWLVPHLAPKWLEDGDTVEIWVQDGSVSGSRWHQSVVTTAAAGTDADTASTNFDTLTMATVVAEALPAGAPIRLVEKASGALYLPIRSTASPGLHFVGAETIELQTTTPGTVQDSTVTDDGEHDVYATEDGERAPNQETVTVLRLTGTTSNALAVGAQLRRKLGADVTMAEYGGSATWTDTDASSVGGGFEAVVPDSLAGVIKGRSIDVEITMIANTDLRLVVDLLDQIVGGRA